MYDHGGENCVNEFYHTWFGNGSAKWDRVGVSTYGPAPGYLVGGPNPSYDWDSCCPGNCGGSNNTVCNSESLTPPKGQPNQKSYKDFNTSWPLNSWSVTENSDGYQIGYIRLLAKYVVADGAETIVGIGKDEKNAIVVSPNPTTGLVNLAVPSGEYDVRVVNSYGKTVLVENKKGASSINLAPFSSGVYFVMIRFGDRQLVQKVIKY